MFILSFCLMGMNSADLFLCDTISESKGTLTITYNRAKTATRRTDKAKISVNIHPFILPIYEKYKDVSEERVFRYIKSIPLMADSMLHKCRFETDRESSWH